MTNFAPPIGNLWDSVGNTPLLRIGSLSRRTGCEIGLRHRGEGLRIVTFLCDHGSRYASKIFNSEFLASKQLQPRPLVERSSA